MSRVLWGLWGCFWRCCGLMALVLSLDTTPTSAEGDLLQRGSYSIRAVRILDIKEGKPVRLSQDTLLAADRIILDATIITNGHFLQIDARNIDWKPRAKIVAFDTVPGVPDKPPKQARGSDGVPFSKSQEQPQELPHSIRGAKQGVLGVKGKPGIPGMRDPAGIVVVAMEIDGTPIIDARGQNGGKGGPGGNGGDGGDGARGQDAWSRCGSDSAVCRGGSSRGGGGGNGGPGGQGGVAGMGGGAVPMVFAVSRLPSVLASWQMRLGPGLPGDPGEPGAPGSHGRPGKSGRPSGCCRKMSWFPPFALLDLLAGRCVDCRGAAGGVERDFPDPGNLGRGEENVSGDNIDLAGSLLADFADEMPLFSDDGVVNGFAVALDDVRNVQNQVFDDLVEFNFSRTFAYLLQRSFSLAGVEPGNAKANVGEADELVATMVSDIWLHQFVNPLERDIVSGEVSDASSAKAWVKRGNRIVQLFTRTAAPGALDELTATLERSISSVEDAAARFGATCRSFTFRLTGHSDVLVHSHQIAIPACQRLANLSGAQIIVEPLVVREPLPSVPVAFQRFIVEDPLEFATLDPHHGRSPVEKFFNFFVGRAYAQAIEVEVLPVPGEAVTIDPTEVGIDPRKTVGKRFVVQSFGTNDSASYSATDLIIDLRLFREALR